MTPADNENAIWITTGGRVEKAEKVKVELETGILEEEVETAAAEPMTAMDP